MTHQEPQPTREKEIRAAIDRLAQVAGITQSHSSDVIVCKAEASEILRRPADRRRLPRHRQGTTHEVRIAGQKVFLRTGNYEDGTLGEIFIDMHKESAAFRSLLACFAICVSMALQYGMPLEDLVDQFTFTRFEPKGRVDGHDNIKACTSVIDYVFRVLGLEYLGRTDLAQIVPEGGIIHAAAEAPNCTTCGQITVRNGTMFKCLNCGASMEGPK